jgi:integrase
MEISEMLGHANISITMDRYGHLVFSRQKELAEAMAQLRPEGEVMRMEK